MARSTLTWMRVVAVAALAAQTVAQDARCYYPNGKLAPVSEQPCSSAEGSACCPNEWQCLDNGLCYNPSAKIYGTYSCTDKNWNAPGCPSNLCMYGPSKDKLRAGGESITQCSTHNDDWCCNADATNVKCCQESPEPRPFFQLQDGRAYATIGQKQADSAPTLSSITGIATSGGGSQASRTPEPSSLRALSSSRSLSTPDPVTSVTQIVSSGSAGVVTIEKTALVTPPPTDVSTTSNNGNTNSSSSGSSSNLGVIVGCAVGIPLALALLGILIWLLRKRRTQKNTPYTDSPEMEGSPVKPGFAGGKLGKDVYRHSQPGTAEIDGAPIGATRPVSNVPGHAELPSGTGFQAGNGPAFAPDTVGLGGGNGDGRATWGSPPPGYSPGMNQAGFAHPTHAMELADTSVMPVVNQKEGAQQYQAYRPPQEAAELPTVKTPPEDLERQVQR